MRLYKFRRLKGASDAEVDKLRGRILDIVNAKHLFCEKWQQFPDKYEGAYISFAGLTPDDINELGKARLRSEEEYFEEVERRGLIKNRVISIVECVALHLALCPTGICGKNMLMLVLVLPLSLLCARILKRLL